MKRAKKARNVGQRHPAETLTGFAAVLFALLVWLGFDERGAAIIVGVVGGIPTVVTTIVEWWRGRSS